MNEAERLDVSRLMNEYDEMLLRMAVVRAAELDAQELEQSAQSGCADFTPEDMDASARAARPRIRRIRPRRRGNREKSAPRALPGVLRVAVCALLGFYLLSTLALAVSPAVRVYFTRLLINVKPRYTELSMEVDTEHYVDVPEGWTGEYYMSWIPRGLR